MKKIKLKICNANLADKFSFGNFFLGVLRKYYQVELSDNPDYVIYNDSDYEYLKYDCIRICFSGENVSPNFNLCDYAIGCDYLTFGDRFYRMPLYLIAQFYSEEELALAKTMLAAPQPEFQPDFTKQKPFTKEDLAKKTSFCSFVYSNYLADSSREELFNKLSEYKKVDSGGAYLNNTGTRIKNKLSFEAEHKFSIACENSSRSGYITEKLTNALVARTIPIYMGNPDVAKEFNQERFINCHAFPSLDEVVARVKQIDQDDELYLKIINQPVAAPGYDFNLISRGLEDFLRHIIDQPLGQARRRTINTGRKAQLEANEALVYKITTKKTAAKRALARLYRPFKKISVLEKLKQKFFASRLRSKQ